MPWCNWSWTRRFSTRPRNTRKRFPEVFLLTYQRAVQGDRNAINRALNNLKVWDIPQDEIDALHAEAKKISADKNAWFKTPEGRWVKGEKQATTGKADPDKELENPWGRVTLRAPFDGIIVERNVHMDEMVVDNTVNLFQIADVSRLLVIANCPEDALPTLEALHGDERRWTVRTVGTEATTGLPGTIDEIGYLIDPNQHTAVIKGYVDNPGKHIRAGQYVTATVNIPPPNDVVEIPIDALVDDGQQSVVFVQPDAGRHQFTMRRVQVTHRFDRTVFVRSTPIPKEEQLTAQEAEEGLLPKEPLRPGERVLLAGAVELKAAVLDLESRPREADDLAKANRDRRRTSNRDRQEVESGQGLTAELILDLRKVPMVRKLIAWALDNPLVVILLAVFLAVIGVYSFLNVNVEAYPDPAPAIVEVIALFPGASAEEVERQVTIPLEVTFAGMPGLKKINSKSLFGLSDLKMTWHYGSEYTYEAARQEVINRMATITQPLPPNVTPAISPESPTGEIFRYILKVPKDAVRQRDLHAQRHQGAAGLGAGARVPHRAADRGRHQLRRHGAALRGSARPGPPPPLRHHAGPAPGDAGRTATPRWAATTSTRARLP